MGRLLNHRVLGTVFIGLMVLAVWFVYAVFTQKFISYDKITLHTDSIGLQLPQRAEVKVRGVLVGEVLKTRAGRPGHGATLTLGIKPDKIGQVPSNVTASLLPKTLFGEKYVELSIPEHPSTTPLRAGDRIAQTSLPPEVEQVLADIYPLLETVQPAQLNYTLNALATALEGRGEEIGRSITTLDGYLKRLNPQVPALVGDLKKLAAVSATYADVTPELAAILRDSVKTGNTLLSRQAKLHQFLRSAAAFSDTARSFLAANGDNIVRLGQVSEPTAALLRRYSPEFPCLLQGITGVIPRLSSTFRGFVFHIQLVVLPKQPRAYNAGDAPIYGADNPASCGGLPHPKGSPAHPYTAPNFNDGVNNLGRGDNQRVATGFDRTSARGAAASDQLSAGVGGTAAQKALVNALTAPVLGQPADSMPDIDTLLFAPLAAGTQISMQPASGSTSGPASGAVTR